MKVRPSLTMIKLIEEAVLLDMVMTLTGGSANPHTVRDRIKNIKEGYFLA